jgi:hypothetical protein
MSRESRGHVSFDSYTDDAFRNLVAQTLESSDFIEAEFQTVDGGQLGDAEILVIYEDMTDPEEDE